MMPAASSADRSPLSAASTANFRAAVIRTLMEMQPRPRASGALARRDLPRGDAIRSIVDHLERGTLFMEPDQTPNLFGRRWTRWRAGRPAPKPAFKMHVDIR